VPKRPRPGGRLPEQVVLVVEDKFLIAMELELLLGQNGWRVLGPAPTVEVALELLNEEIPGCGDPGYKCEGQEDYSGSGGPAKDGCAVHGDKRLQPGRYCEVS
jgi:hypothetical protein